MGYVPPPEAGEGHASHGVAGHGDVFNFASVLLTLLLWEPLPTKITTLHQLVSYIQEKTPRIQVSLAQRKVHV